MSPSAKDMGQRGLDSRSGRRRARMKGPRSLTSRALSSYLFLQDWHSQCRPSFFLIFVLRGANFFLALLILISEATLSSKSSFKHAFGQYFDLIFWDPCHPSPKTKNGDSYWLENKEINEPYQAQPVNPVASYLRKLELERKVADWPLQSSKTRVPQLISFALIHVQKQWPLKGLF